MFSNPFPKKQKNLTTLLIIGIWKSTFRGKKTKNETLNPVRKGGDDKGPLVLNEFFTK
jgi:hypothetical protein